MKIERALLSVWDKTDLAVFAEGLSRQGVELVASGGTARFLADAGLTATPIEELTGFADMLGHRVVTLHPAVHGGILARRDVRDDLADLERHGIGAIDLVCVNLYPFEDTVAQLGVTWQQVVETIDVGGPAMLRAAAKNHAHVVAICRPEDYTGVLDELRASGTVSEETRRGLARRAFSTTAAYDAAVAAWLGAGVDLPETYLAAFDRSLELAYGENPGQRAAYFVERGARAHLLSRVEQVQGKPLSYNNLNDLAAARAIADELDGAACVIVKHANPCGVATAETVEDAYARAVAADPISAYGGVVVVTRPVQATLGRMLAEQFVEVLHAPRYDDPALEALSARPGTRVLVDRERRAADRGELDIRRVPGGLLVQDDDSGTVDRSAMEVVCGDVGEETWRDLLFAWVVAKHAASNAIVIARAGQTLGIGAGQTSRVDAVRLAIDKARDRGHDLAGAVLASDAFFPFPDGPRLALDAGVRALIQPGGSKRDDEVTDLVRAAGAAQVFTGRRHFRH